MAEVEREATRESITRGAERCCGNAPPVLQICLPSAFVPPPPSELHFPESFAKG